MDKQTIEQIKKFIQSDDEPDKLVEQAEYIAKNDISSISTSQLRNIFGAIKKLEMSPYDEKVYRQLVLIKPKLAYMKGRAGNKIEYRNIEDILGAAIDEVKDKETFVRFCEFIEAILAYHKVYGDKKNV